MASILAGYQYDIFISYRHNDNRSGWVTDFVNALQEELAATIKEPLSIYFDKNPHDGLLETHHVDKSLEGKLKCLIFIPILSQTYCDPKSFAWQHEFCAFNKLAREDQFGKTVKLSGGNVAGRILPVKIHELDMADKAAIEAETGDVLRSIDFIYKEAGVNRPLRAHEENPGRNQNQTIFRNQVNKVANAVKSLVAAMNNQELRPEPGVKPAYESPIKTEGSAPASSNFRLVMAVGITAVVCIAVAWFLFQQSGRVGAAMGQAVTRASILPPAGSRIELIGEATVGAGRRAISISAQGDRVAFIGSHQGRPHIFIRDLNSYETRVLDQTTGAYGCRISPNGQEVAYFVGNKVLKIDVQGVNPTTIAESSNPMDIAWISDTVLYFSANEGAALYKASKEVEPVTTGSFGSLSTIPNTEILLVSPRDQAGALHLFDMRSNEFQKLEVSGTSAKFVLPDRIVCMRGSTAFVHVMDMKTFAVDPKPLHSLPNIRVEAYGNAQFDVSANGSLVYVEGEDTRVGNLVRVARDGHIDTISQAGEEYGAFKLSPDGAKLAVPINNASQDLWVFDLKSSKRTRVTNSGKAGNPVWVNNEILVFRQDTTVYRVNLEKSSAPEAILARAQPLSVTADGTQLLLLKAGAFINYDFTAGKVTPIAQVATGSLHHGSISPSGQLVAYTFNDTKSFHVYIRHMKPGGKNIQVSTREGSEEPRWTRDGKRIIYRSGQQWFEVTVLNAETLEVSEPKLVLEGDYYNIGGFSFDITGDGQQFILVKTPTEKTASEIKLVTGWASEVGNRP